jgi:hypothetical protein
VTLFLVIYFSLFNDSRDFRCLEALGTLLYGELNFLALFQGLETLHCDGAVMNEDIITIFPADEPEPLGRVEPLDGSNMTF